MDVITIEAQPRETGKSAVRAIRREGDVPCIVYGHSREPLVFKLPELQMTQLAHSRETRRILVTVGKDSVECILKDVDFHPVTSRPLHADFVELTRGEKISVSIPLRFHGTPIGQVDDGGETQYSVHELQIKCLPEDIPTHLDVDVAHLRIGDSLHISDLKLENIEFEHSPEKNLVTVLAPRLQAVEEEEELEPGELETEAEELIEPEDQEE